MSRILLAKIESCLLAQWLGSRKCFTGTPQKHRELLFFYLFVFQVEVSGPRRVEDFGAGGVAEAPQGGEEAEEAGVAAEEDLEEGRRCWLNHTDMKVHVSFLPFFPKLFMENLSFI